MNLQETPVARLLWFAAKGQADEAQRYAGHILKQGTDLAPIRAGIESMIGPGFYFEMLEALPWLAAAEFGNPLAAPSTPAPDASPSARIIDILKAAGNDGERATTMRARFSDRAAFDAAISWLESERKIIGADETSGGRSARRYWIVGSGNLQYEDDGTVVRNIDPFAYAADVLRRARESAGDID